jgi:hypothetical protein
MKTSAILSKFYVYDPGIKAGDELGRLRVFEDDKGLHVMSTPMQIQYWVDQGLAGLKPLGELSDVGKKFLAQITRGRSEDNDATPPKLPTYDKMTQSGTPISAMRQTMSNQRRLQMSKEKKGRGAKKVEGKKTEEKKAAETKPSPPKLPPNLAPSSNTPSSGNVPL